MKRSSFRVFARNGDRFPERRMTYIEFFDKIASENVCACLTYAPERVIYIGDDKGLMNKHIRRYQKIFDDKEPKIDFDCRSVSRSKLNEVVALLSELVETYDDCVFDITGGDEMYILALGIVTSRYPDKNIQIHKFNLRNNAIYDCDTDGVTIFRQTPKLSVDENIRIYGGEVSYGTVDEDKTYRWDMNADFACDLEQMWEICIKSGRAWNVQIGVFAAMEEIGCKSEDGLTLVAPMLAVEKYLHEHSGSYVKDVRILSELQRRGLIPYFSDSDENAVTVTFKNKQVKKCLVMAGRVLEMKIFRTAKELREKDGDPVYNDALNGVLIDWDGELHEEEAGKFYDTENEIDVLLMHDVVPVFISCKNGKVPVEELYKLETVAERFGGPYAKKVLVATALKNAKEPEYIRNRAKDMNVKLVEIDKETSDKELAQTLRNLWR